METLCGGGEKGFDAKLNIGLKGFAIWKWRRNKFAIQKYKSKSKWGQEGILRKNTKRISCIVYTGYNVANSCVVLTL